MARSIEKKRTKDIPEVCVLGLGYVGLTLAVTCAERGYRVVAVDTNTSLIRQLQKGNPHFFEPGLKKKMLKYRYRLLYTTNISEPLRRRIYIIAVGTNIGAQHRPISGHLRAASRMIGGMLQKGDMVILRSTVALGTTRSLVIPLLEKKSGLRSGPDIHVAFAPERTIEGKALEELITLPQIVGGTTLECTAKVSSFFDTITKHVVRTATLEEAELAKLMSNAYRDLTFAFANNLARIGSEQNVDVNAAINAANDGYARNRIPQPSPGVGGYCLTKDPYLLVSAAKQRRVLRLHAEGRRVNESMPSLVADTVGLFCTSQKIKKPSILIVGLAFKGNPPTSDVRYSPSRTLINELRARGYTRISGYDALVGEIIYTKWDIVRVKDLQAGLHRNHVVVYMHNNPTYSRATLPRTNSAKLLLDPWALQKGNTVTDKGWAYATLSHRTF